MIQVVRVELPYGGSIEFIDTPGRNHGVLSFRVTVNLLVIGEFDSGGKSIMEKHRENLKYYYNKNQPQLVLWLINGGYS